ncbi:polysaccharide biosynthesis C-terminal domain-containing protein [Roseivirga thermotolerans]|uniref:polysaccharide biosynthesis C-terminal domain-containing protein n=1 Tax=Roseivirga thermotolerans TaxID=1758176 RepID=UPI00273DF6B4|nr:NAD-dependent epimerase/dehydratase family protein [Roseivirga thermotolerans]
MKKTRVGITGQNGFIGSHLKWTLDLNPDAFEVISFEKSYFQDEAELDTFVGQCDVLVHLAAMNRHESQQVIHDTNIALTQTLIASLERTGATPYVLFSSSTQELADNLYGKSKKACALALENWAKSSGGSFTSLIIPNVYGPFSKPYYNTFIATFCHQLVSGDEPQVNGTSSVDLIYVGEVVASMLELIEANLPAGQVVESKKISSTKTITVGEVFDLLKSYNEMYVGEGRIPALTTRFELNLFNTFRSYMDHGGIYPRHYVKHTDNRGLFVELLRLGGGGQVSYSTTKPGITRGNHFHTRKVERFSVISGKAQIELRRIDQSEKLTFDLDGNDPSYVDMPIWYTHNITNTGDSELLTVFWINEFYDPNDPDTYFVEV